MRSLFGQTALSLIAGMVVSVASVRTAGETGWLIMFLIFLTMALLDAMWNRKQNHGGGVEYTHHVERD